MIAQYKITPSLYSAWRFWQQSSEEYRAKAYNDFLCQLNKIPQKPTEAQQAGLDYEEKIQAVAERFRCNAFYDTLSFLKISDVPDKLVQEVNKVANAISSDTTSKKPVLLNAQDIYLAYKLQDAFWQGRINKNILVDDMIWNINGRFDAFSPSSNILYDLKYTSRTFCPGMFDQSIQHLCYMYALGVKHFQYLVRRNVSKINAIYIDDYCYNQIAQIEESLKNRIREFYISIMIGPSEIHSAYMQRWSSKGKDYYENEEITKKGEEPYVNL